MAKGKRVKKSKANGGKIAVIALSAAIVVAAAAFVLTGVRAAGTDTIFPNITVSGVEVGGMEYAPAHSKLLNSGVGISGDVSATVELTDDVKLVVTSDDAGLTSSVTDAIDAAYAYGREGNFISNTFTYINCLGKEHDILSETVFDEEAIRSIIADAAKRAEHTGAEASYKVLDTEIVATKGTSGYTVDQEGVYEFIHDTLMSGESASTDKFSEAKYVKDTGKGVDFNLIYEDIFVEMKNAELNKETFKATEGVTGVSFDVDEAKRVYNAAKPGDTVHIPLIFTEPEITAETLEGYLFRDKLSSKMTTMYSSSSNRINNITLAAKAINGTVLNPGDEFSFNGTVGERTEKKGYKPAGAYVGGESVDQVGGGICQVSSTIYYCTLKANLEIVSRSNHMFSVSYLPLGFDATVNWGSLDYKFKNNQEYPVKIVAYVKNKELTVELWGTKLDDSYVELQYSLVSTIDYSVVEQEDPSVPQGKTKVKTSGHQGYVVDAYQLLYDGDGKLISKNYLGRDTYRKQDRVVLIPVAKEDPNPPVDPVDPPVDPVDPPVDPVDPPVDPVDPPVDPVDPPVDPPVNPDPDEDPDEGIESAG